MARVTAQAFESDGKDSANLRWVCRRAVNNARPRQEGTELTYGGGTEPKTAGQRRRKIRVPRAISDDDVAISDDGLMTWKTEGAIAPADIQSAGRRIDYDCSDVSKGDSGDNSPPDENHQNFTDHFKSLGGAIGLVYVCVRFSRQ